MALFGHAAISELSLLSGAEVGFEPAKGSFWRNAVIPAQALRFELAVDQLPGQVLIAVKIRCVGCHVCLQ
jgi:hypothetical protein